MLWRFEAESCSLDVTEARLCTPQPGADPGGVRESHVEGEGPGRGEQTSGPDDLLGHGSTQRIWSRLLGQLPRCHAVSGQVLERQGDRSSSESMAVFAQSVRDRTRRDALAEEHEPALRFPPEGTQGGEGQWAITTRVVAYELGARGELGEVAVLPARGQRVVDHGRFGHAFEDGMLQPAREQVRRTSASSQGPIRGIPGCRQGEVGQGLPRGDGGQGRAAAQSAQGCGIQPSAHRTSGAGQEGAALGGGFRAPDVHRCHQGLDEGSVRGVHRRKQPPALTDRHLAASDLVANRIRRHSGWSHPFPRTPTEGPMAEFRLELDEPNNIVLVMVTEDDGSEHDYQFDFDPRSGRWEFGERDLLERDFGEEWVDEMEEAIETTIKGVVEKNADG